MADAALAEDAPPTSRQKTYIFENAGILDLGTKKAILRLVMMEVGAATEVKKDGEKINVPVVVESKTAKEVSILLDNINAAVILLIYNIVRRHRDTLDEPATT